MGFDPVKPKPVPGTTPSPSQGDVADVAANDALEKLELGKGRIDFGSILAGDQSSLTAPLNARFGGYEEEGPGIDQQAMGVLGNALTWSIYSRERPLIGLDTALKNLTGHGFIDDVSNAWNSFDKAGKDGNLAAAATTGSIGFGVDILTNKFSRGRLNAVLAQQLIDVKGKGLGDKLSAADQSRFSFITNPEEALASLAADPLSALNALNPMTQVSSFLEGKSITNFLLETVSGGIKVSEVYDQARKRGFTDQDIRDLQDGNKSIYDFGGFEYMVADNAFVDFGADIATDPMTYLTFGVSGIVKGAAKSVGTSVLRGATKKITFRGVELGFGAFGKSATNGLRTAVARGAHAFSELKRVGLVRKVAPASDEAAEALLKGDVTAATAEGLGEAAARVAIGAESGSRYVRTIRAAGRKVGRGVIAYDVFATGYTVLEGAAEYSSDNIFKPGERSGFIDAFLDFTDETTKVTDENGNVERRRFLSDKVAFIIVSAQHYRPGQVINALGYDFIKKQITKDGTNAVKYLLKSDFEGPILDELTKGVEGVATRDQKRAWVIKTLDNDEQAYWSLIELGISRVVALGSRDGSYAGLNPNLRRALQVSAESADDIIVSGNRRWAAILREARRAMDSGELTGKQVAEILSDWGRKTKNEIGQGRKTRVEGLEYDLSPEEFLANFKNYRKRANQLAEIVGERVPVVLALYDDIPTQEIYLEVLDQLRSGGTATKGKKYTNIFGEEVNNVTIDKTQLREILLNRSSLMSGKNAQKIARFLEKDVTEELTLKEFEQLISFDYDRAPTHADIMSAIRLHERLAPEPLGASPITQDVDGVVSTAPLRERPVEVTVSRMRPEIERSILGEAGLEPVISPEKVRTSVIEDVMNNEAVRAPIADLVRARREAVRGEPTLVAAGAKIYSEGGCLVLAVALQRKYGGRLIAAWEDIDDTISPGELIDHVALELPDGTIIDGSGKYTPDEFLDNLADNGWEEPAFDYVSYGDGDGYIFFDKIIEDIPFDETISNQIFDALNEADPRISASGKIKSVELADNSRMTTPEIAVFEEVVGEFINLSDAAQVRTVERSIGLYDGAVEPSVTITLAPTETLAGARRAAAIALRGFSSDTRNWQSEVLIVSDAPTIARSVQAGVLDLNGQPIKPNSTRLVWKIKNLSSLPAAKVQAIIDGFDFPITYNKATGEITAVFIDEYTKVPIEKAISKAEATISNIEGVKLDGRSGERVYAELFGSGTRDAEGNVIRDGNNRLVGKSPELLAVESDFRRFGLGGILDAASSTEGIVHLTTDAAAAAAKRRAESRPPRYSASGTLESLEAISATLLDDTIDAVTRTEAENSLIEALHSSSMSDAQIATWLQSLETKLKGGASAPLSSMSGGPSYSPLKLVKELMETGLSEEVAEATAQLVELRARAWARESGRPMAEYYASRIERIIAEESDPAMVDSLFQAKKQDLEERFADPDITPEQALKLAEEFELPRQMANIGGPKLKPELVEIPGLVDSQGRPRKVVIPGGRATLEPTILPSKIASEEILSLVERDDVLDEIAGWSGGESYGNIFQEGGCLVLAVAVQRKHGGKLYGITDETGTYTHVGVLLDDGRFVDSYGTRILDSTSGYKEVTIKEANKDIKYNKSIADYLVRELEDIAKDPDFVESIKPEYPRLSLADEVIIRAQAISTQEIFDYADRTGDATPVVEIAKLYKRIWAGKETDPKSGFVMLQKLVFAMLSPQTNFVQNEALHNVVRVRNQAEMRQLATWVREEVARIKEKFPEIRGDVLTSKIGFAYTVKIGMNITIDRLSDYIGTALEPMARENFVKAQELAEKEGIEFTHFKNPEFPRISTNTSGKQIGAAMQLMEWADQSFDNLNWFAIRDGENHAALAQRYTGLRGVRLKVGNFAVEIANPSQVTIGTIDDIMTRVIAEHARDNGTLEALLVRIREVDPDYAKVIEDYISGAKEKADNANGKERKLGKKGWPEGTDLEIAARIESIPAEIRGAGQLSFYEFGGSYKIAMEVLQQIKDEYAQKYGEIFNEMSLGEFQWFMWDKKRGQIEPHSMLADGAEKMPKASPQDIIDGRAELVAANFTKVGTKDAPVKTRPVDPTAVGKLLQERTGEILGSTTFAADGRALIRIGKKADASTALHEFAHVWRRELSGEDLTFFGNRYKVTDGVWTREAEELFVADVEQYVKEGKHPDAQVQNVMGKFKNWLREIYGYLKGEKKLSPEVRARLDKLFEGEDVQAPPMFRESSTLDVLSRLQKDFKTSKGDARLVTTTASAERAALDAARISSFPMPQWHPSMRKSDAQWLNDVRAFEAQLRTLDPDYTVSLPPDTYIPWRDGKMLTQTMKDYIQARSVIYDWIEKIGPLSRTAGVIRTVFSGSNREQSRVSKRFFYRQMIGLGATPKQVEMFLASLQQTADTTGVWDKASVKLFRSGQDLLPPMITAAGEKIFGEKVTAKLKSQNLTYWQVMDRSSSAFYRWLDSKIVEGSKGEAAKLVAARYNAAQGSVLQQWGVRFVSRVFYPVFRFYVDPRWWMLNYLEADILTATQLGVSTAIKGRKLNKRARDGENISSPVTLTHETRQIPVGSEDAGKPVPELDTGWVDNRHLSGYVTAGMDEAAVRNRKRVLEEAGIDGETGDIINLQDTIDWLETNDPDFQWFNEIDSTKITYNSRADQAKAIEARLKAVVDRDAGKPLSQILDEQMYKFDEKGVKKTVEDEAKMLFSPEEFLELQPVIQAISAKNNDSYVAIKRILRGNPNRSHIEKILNSYWALWPISYQLKAGKWFFKVMVDAEGGGTLKNLAKFEYIRAKFETNMQEKEEFRNIFENNPTLWQIARMIMPMDPSEYGVSLGRPTRYTGQMLGLLEQSAVPMDPIRAAIRSLSIGPLYFAELIQYAAREGSFDRIVEEIQSLLPDFGSEEGNKEETP